MRVATLAISFLWGNGLITRWKHKACLTNAVRHALCFYSF